MKSILWQLSKYKKKTDPPKIEVEDDLPSNTITIYELARRIAEACYANELPALAQKWIEERTNLIVTLCKDLPRFHSADRLYPLEILCVYHCFYAHGRQVCGELVADKFLFDFLLESDLEEYIQLFDKTASNTAKKLAMTRVFQATYPPPKYDATKYDKLPRIPFRAAAAKYLNLKATSVVAAPSVGDAAKLQESLNKSATIEDIILGRIGYLMIWHWWDKRGSKINNPQVPLLTHKQ